jgi:hypothetical protein
LAQARGSSPRLGVRGHLDQDLVARQHADAVLAHAAGGMGDDLMFVF